MTLWDVGDDHSFMHDEISTDKNHPTVNANGPIYAVSAGHGQLVDARSERRTAPIAIDIPTRAPRDEGAVALPDAESSVAAAGATSICGRTRRTTRPIRTTRCSTARAACG